MIGCNTDDVNLQDDLPDYEAQLKTLGFEFQLLGSDNIQRYLRDNRVAVETILGPEYIPFVCGTALRQRPPPSCSATERRASRFT
jgi:hypothetical protein